MGMFEITTGVSGKLVFLGVSQIQNTPLGMNRVGLCVYDQKRRRLVEWACWIISVRSSVKCSRITLSANSSSAGVIEAAGLFKSIFFFAGFPLNVWPNLLAWLKLIACPLYTSFRSSGY
jgi:hypothetical protein